MPKLGSTLMIFIPTRGRLDKQWTAKFFLVDKLPWEVVRVVPQCEQPFWRHEGVKYLVVPDSYRFSDIRQCILQQPGKYHVVIDDDLVPALRDPENSTKFLSIPRMPLEGQIHHIQQMFIEILGLLDKGWVHGGLAVRQGANNVKEKYSIAAREMRFHFYNAEVVRSLGHDFRRVVIKQDLDFTLCMLKKGIPNIIINSYVQEQHDGNNTEGGCSRYRTQEMLVDGAKRLAALHQPFVKVVEKKPKTAWKGQSRLDVNVAWKQAFRKGLEYARSLQRKDPRSLDDKDRAVVRLQHQLSFLPHFAFEKYQ